MTAPEPHDPRLWLEDVQGERALAWVRERNAESEAVLGSDPRFEPGPETIEAQLFDEAEIPWEQLAFRTVKETLERYFADRRAGRFGFHAFDIA